MDMGHLASNLFLLAGCFSGTVFMILSTGREEHGNNDATDSGQIDAGTGSQDDDQKRPHVDCKDVLPSPPLPF